MFWVLCQRTKCLESIGVKVNSENLMSMYCTIWALSLMPRFLYTCSLSAVDSTFYFYEERVKGLVLCNDESYTPFTLQPRMRIGAH